MRRIILVCLFLASAVVCDNYLVGVGKADVTGPAAGIGMMGYAKQGQNTAGIHIRQFSRAFIFDDRDTRVVFVSVDAGMMGQLVKMGVIEQLQAEFGSMYTHENVVISGTHTHSGPAGYLQYVLFDVTCLGWIEESYSALVTGIVESIRRAHNGMQEARVYYTQGELHDANINRSPTSYLANPEEERQKYDYDTDHTFTQLNIISTSGQALGIVNWFAVHPTSMNNTNHLISGDNKGAASQFLEQSFDNKLVAAFASTNLGDVSPNLDGPKCIDTGLPCDLEHSTCDGLTQNCIASGPGENMFESTRIIAERQLAKSAELFADAANYEELSGPIGFTHQWINMTNQVVELPDGTQARTCPAAMGYSFAAGTTDGPGEFDFTQGTNTSNPFWDAIAGILKDPSPEQEACHAPKPILLDTGEINFPYKWHPDIIDTQVLRIGDLFITAVPGEFTTMSGRRLRDTVKTSAIAAGGSESTKVVIAGLSNVYTHYIATYEEYQKQRYEAASTIYGPHTLRAYQQQYAYLVDSLVRGEPVPQLTPPPNLHDDQLSFVPGVVFDAPPIGHAFGDCLQEPPQAVYAGETVQVRFVSGHPRNNLMLESTFLTVEKLEEDGSWAIVATDTDWETKFEWFRTNVLLGESEAQVTWEVPEDVVPGQYRIRHFGYHKSIIPRSVLRYEGQTREFQVLPENSIRRFFFPRPQRIRPNVFKHLEKLIKKTFTKDQWIK